MTGHHVATATTDSMVEWTRDEPVCGGGHGTGRCKSRPGSGGRGCRLVARHVVGGHVQGMTTLCELLLQVVGQGGGGTRAAVPSLPLPLPLSPLSMHRLGTVVCGGHGSHQAAPNVLGQPADTASAARTTWCGTRSRGGGGRSTAASRSATGCSGRVSAPASAARMRPAAGGGIKHGREAVSCGTHLAGTKQGRAAAAMHRVVGRWRRICQCAHHNTGA